MSSSHSTPTSFHLRCSSRPYFNLLRSAFGSRFHGHTSQTTRSHTGESSLISFKLAPLAGANSSGWSGKDTPTVALNDQDSLGIRMRVWSGGGVSLPDH